MPWPLSCSKPLVIEKRAPGYPPSGSPEPPVSQRHNPTSQFSVRLPHKSPPPPSSAPTHGGTIQHSHNVDIVKAVLGSQEMVVYGEDLLRHSVADGEA